jgi:hypothetical protein
MLRVRIGRHLRSEKYIQIRFTVEARVTIRYKTINAIPKAIFLPRLRQALYVPYMRYPSFKTATR